MTIQEIASRDLAGSAKDLFVGRCVVAITPDAGDPEFADNAVWSLARAAASTGRRTALIDLNLDEPRLHSRAHNPKDTGIVDAFLFGASLQHVASQEDDTNLHFIGVGTPTPEPEEVWASDRWERLVRGFNKEEAILLLYMPPSALDTLACAPDLIIAIAPHGLGSSGPQHPQLRSAIDRGLPLAAVIDRSDAAPEEELEGTEKTPTLTEQHSRLPSKILMVVLAVVATAMVVVLLVVMSGGRKNRDTDEQETRVPRPADSTSIDSIIPQDTVGQRAGYASPVPGADSLPYSIQVAAWTQLGQAQTHLDKFEGSGIAATISVVPRDSSGHWFRVFVGAATDYRSANALRDSLRSMGLIGRNRGVLRNTPLALLLETHPDSLSGSEAARGLRESGIPAYIVSMPDGSLQVLVGAFESPDQADLIDLVFPETDRDLSGTLVTRMGSAR